MLESLRKPRPPQGGDGKAIILSTRQFDDEKWGLPGFKLREKRDYQNHFFTAVPKVAG